MKISPRVVKKGVSVDFILEIKNIKYIDSIVIFSQDNYFHKESVAYKEIDSKLHFNYKMECIGEFVVQINFTYKESSTISIYCTEEELGRLRPFKGDLHMHTIFSDGNRTPIAMILSSLEKGMDFISITDHDTIEGYLEGAKKADELEIDILILPGEEVSVGRGDVSRSKGNGHILSINADGSIEELRKDKNRYKEELAKIVDNLDIEELEEGIDPFHYAKNIWTIESIASLGGISILAHPNWVYYDKKYHLHQPIYKEMLKNSKIDAIEVFGDIEGDDECNNLAYLEYLQTKNRFKYIAPIANSDAHNSDVELGERFSIIFAKELTCRAVVEAIKSGHSCAVSKRSSGKFEFIAKSEIAHYVNFLLREYYPKHQKLKSKLAKLYMDEVLNNQSFKKKIELTKERINQYERIFFNFDI